MRTLAFVILIAIFFVQIASAPVAAQEDCQILSVGDSTFRFCEKGGIASLELISAPEGVIENLRLNQHLFPSVDESFEISALVVGVVDNQSFWYKVSKEGNLWYRYFGVGYVDRRIVEVSSGFGWSPLDAGQVLVGDICKVDINPQTNRTDLFCTGPMNEKAVQNRHFWTNEQGKLVHYVGYDGNFIDRWVYEDDGQSYLR